MTGVLSYAGRNIKWNAADDAKDLVNDLEKTKEVKCLKLEANTLGVEAAKVIGDALAKHPEFERAHWKDLFTGRLKTEIPQALKHLFSGIERANAKLIELDLSDNALGPIGVEGMVEFIKSPCCFSLQELRLNNNGLGIKGGTMLAKALMTLAEKAAEAGTPLKLKVFISGRNRLENNGATILSKFFTMVKTLEEIAMPQNGIFHPGIAALAKSFSHNPGLRIINLNDNTFTPVGARAMAEELPKMSNLEVINFGDCLLKTPGALAVSEALKDSHEKLKELHLDSNEIRIEGGTAIIDILKNKPNISLLNLDANQFGEEGLDEIVNQLESIGKKDILGSMEDNEEPDDDEEEEEDGDEDEEEEEEDEDEEESEVEETGISPLKKDQGVQPQTSTLNEFLAAPSAARLLGLTCDTSQILEEVKKSVEVANQEAIDSLDLLIQEYMRIFMNIASLSICNDKKVSERVQTLTREIAKHVFTTAEKNNVESIVINSILVHMGLLKSENKNLEICWDLGGALTALADVTSCNIVPKSSKHTLQFFFSRPGLTVDKHPQEKHKLLTALYKA